MMTHDRTIEDIKSGKITINPAKKFLRLLYPFGRVYDAEDIDTGLLLSQILIRVRDQHDITFLLYSLP